MTVAEQRFMESVPNRLKGISDSLKELVDVLKDIREGINKQQSYGNKNG